MLVEYGTNSQPFLLVTLTEETITSPVELPSAQEAADFYQAEVFTLAAPWTVKEADALSINYDAVVSAVSQPVTGQEIMSVVFVLEWA